MSRGIAPGPGDRRPPTGPMKRPGAAVPSWACDASFSRCSAWLRCCPRSPGRRRRPPPPADPPSSPGGSAARPARPARSFRPASFPTPAGTIMLAVVLRNTSGTTCTVRGYPALRLYRPHRYLPTTVHHGGLVPLNRPVRTITLHPRGQATVLVAYHDVPSGTKPCLTATSLHVFSSGRLDGVPVSVRAMACGGVLAESPLIAGVVHAP